MTWYQTAHEYRMFLSKEIGSSLGRDLYFNAKRYMRDLCGVEHACELEWLVHPGGKKILDTLQDPKFGLCLSREQLAFSYNVLRRHGNMSSPTILFVLARMLEKEKRSPGSVRDTALLMGFGPGITIELVALCRIWPRDESD